MSGSEQVEMLVSSLCGHLPSANGCDPGGVWERSFLQLTAWPATMAPVTALLSTGRRCTAAMHEQTKIAMYRNLCCTWYADYVATWVTIVRMALLSKQALGVTVASTRTWDVHEDLGHED